MTAPVTPIPDPTNQDEFNGAMTTVMERIRTVLMAHLLAECEANPWVRPSSVMELTVIVAMSGVYAYAGRDRTLECIESQRVNYANMPEEAERPSVQ